MSHFEEELSRELKFKGKIVELWHDQVELENGKAALREVIRHPGAVAVLVRDRDALILVRQYRYAARMEMLEVCAGKLEPGEEPAPAAIRELEEETGFGCGPLVPLGDYYGSPGILSEVIHLYYTEPAGRKAAHPDIDEFVSTVRVGLKEFEAMIARGEIADGKTLAAYTLARARGLLE